MRSTFPRPTTLPDWADARVGLWHAVLSLGLTATFLPSLFPLSEGSLQGPEGLVSSSLLLASEAPAQCLPKPNFSGTKLDQRSGAARKLPGEWVAVGR